VPLEGTTAVETLMVRQTAPPPRLSRTDGRVPRWLARLVRRMLEPDPRDRPTAEEVSAALATHRLSWRPARRQLRVAALAVVGGLGLAAVGLGIRELVASPPLDAASPLFASTEEFDNGTRLVIFDGGGSVLWDEALDHRWPIPQLNLADRRPLAFGDLDGDGLQDAVIAYRSTNVDRPLEILLRRRDGTLKRSRSLPSTEGFDYEGEHFGAFRPNDVSCADVDGDGAAEIVLVEHSAGLYPATLRVLRPDGSELFRLWHPGVLRGCVSGDRDGDGRPELYIGGTCNFLTPPTSNTSRPVILVVETDWHQPGQLLDLFGPDRRLRPPDDSGIRLLYAAWPRIDRQPYRKPWQEAVVHRVVQGDGASFLMVNASLARPPTLGLESDREITLRHVFFDRDLRVSGAQWNPVVMAPLAIDPEDPEMQALLRPEYWTGDGWTDEPFLIGGGR
jgi:hypothetical protein